MISTWRGAIWIGSSTGAFAITCTTLNIGGWAAAAIAAHTATSDTVTSAAAADTAAAGLTNTTRQRLPWPAARLSNGWIQVIKSLTQHRSKRKKENSFNFFLLWNQLWSAKCPLVAHLPCIIKHCINFQFIDWVAANTGHSVTMVVEQSKARRIRTARCITSWSFHFFDWIEITGHHCMSGALTREFCGDFSSFISFFPTNSLNFHWIKTVTRI